MYLPGFPPSAPPPVFDPSAYHPPAHMSAQAQAYSRPQLGSAYIPIPTPQPPPQVNTTQPQFDPRAYIPVPSQPQVQPQQQAQPQPFGLIPSITYTPLQPRFATPQDQPQQGNQNPFINQTSTSTSNSNKADDSLSVQFGSGDQGGTVFYAEIVKNVNDGESLGNDDSSGYSGSTDKDGSGVSDYSSESDVKEGMDSEADNLSNDANEKSDLIKKADGNVKGIGYK
ncbi:activating signal cointegrator 1 complex subunit 2 homolog [Helianthus annuus]|uniref:activating signal cointegrator 1 complex subunit 2 homolog n=1 Tax=Helianthus annuus TaxID=4232 RepID=UPI001652D27E|nr:activating signal cointegrator 1 complex subunit 2 homolog [Helianthus annuus]